MRENRRELPNPERALVRLLAPVVGQYAERSRRSQAKYRELATRRRRAPLKQKEKLFSRHGSPQALAARQHGRFEARGHQLARRGAHGAEHHAAGQRAGACAADREVVAADELAVHGDAEESRRGAAVGHRAAHARVARAGDRARAARGADQVRGGADSAGPCLRAGARRDEGARAHARQTRPTGGGAKRTRGARRWPRGGSSRRTRSGRRASGSFARRSSSSSWRRSACRRPGRRGSRRRRGSRARRCCGARRCFSARGACTPSSIVSASSRRGSARRPRRCGWASTPSPSSSRRRRRRASTSGGAR